jgi:integrase
MGAIRQLKNGKFQITVYDTTGRRHRMRFGKHKYAKAYIDKIENEKSEQKLIDAGLMKKTSSVDDSITEFILTKVDLREKSKKKYNRVLEQFRIFCSNEAIVNMNDFTRDHADKFWSAITDSGAAAKTSNFYLMVVKALFENEIKRDRLIKSPFSHIKYLKEKVKSLVEQQEEYYDTNEIKSFFKVQMEARDRQVFQMLLLTGLRISEIQSLKWEHGIDLANKIIKVRNYEGYETKTTTSERDIPMTDLIYKMLLGMKKNNGKGYVFQSMNGGMVSERTLLSKCKNIAEQAGIKKNATLHKWRHTFSSHVLNTEIQYEEKQYLMGHKPESMTDRYTKIDPKSLQKKLTKLDKLIN